MSEYLEIESPEGIRLVAIAGERLSIGRESTNDFEISWDQLVSRQHAVLEHYVSGWSIRDLGSSNGTQVNRKRIWAEQALRPGDEILIGTTLLHFRGELDGKGEPTVQSAPPPSLTGRERDVLVSLCRPVLSGHVFPEPASVDTIAAELFVTPAAVRQHLGNLYDKFAIEEGENRRTRLANDAIRRRAITTSDLA